jgi:hypothetical protein
LSPSLNPIGAKLTSQPKIKVSLLAVEAAAEEAAVDAELLELLPQADNAITVAAASTKESIFFIL